MPGSPSYGTRAGLRPHTHNSTQVCSQRLLACKRKPWLLCRRRDKANRVATKSRKTATGKLLHAHGMVGKRLSIAMKRGGTETRPRQGMALLRSFPHCSLQRKAQDDGCQTQHSPSASLCLTTCQKLLWDKGTACTAQGGRKGAKAC